MMMPEKATISRLYNVSPADNTPHASHIHNMTSTAKPMIRVVFISDILKIWSKKEQYGKITKIFS